MNDEPSAFHFNSLFFFFLVGTLKAKVSYKDLLMTRLQI